MLPTHGTGPEGGTGPFLLDSNNDSGATEGKAQIQSAHSVNNLPEDSRENRGDIIEHPHEELREDMLEDPNEKLHNEYANYGEEYGDELGYAKDKEGEDLEEDSRED